MSRRAIHTVTTASLDTDGDDVSGFAAADSGAKVVAATVVNQDAADVLLVSLDGGTSYPIRVAAGGSVELPVGPDPVLLGGDGDCLHWKAAANTCDNPLLMYVAYNAAEAAA